MASLHMLLCLSQLPFSRPMSRASSSACNLDSNHTPSDGLRRLEPIPSEKILFWGVGNSSAVVHDWIRLKSNCPGAPMKYCM
ncbi:hypothetical protein A9K55_004572 [Cordyceps militaris]|uniref:Uncharacterized protein n=1 Tax=Cordyceps militaris TaxID=73501 RepID=A0A2H4SPM1_CORMI|nr:hypothetical protein A9K55_004572 [Cordyceps militaris]